MAHSEDVVEHFADIIRRANAGFSGHPNTAKMDNVYLTLRMQRWQGRIASATSRIWPCISPFLMRQPMELALSLPVKSRVRHRLTRRLIEHLSPKLARLPLAQGYPALPLRPDTLIHFTPLLTEALHKVLRRVRPSPAFDGHSRVESFRNKELAELTDPSHMLTRDLYDRTSLSELVHEGNPSEQQILRRVLTLELTVRVVRTGARDFAVC
jgi:hypothetical protein